MLPILLWMLFLLLCPFSLAIIITEVHPDPIADESLNEWIEIYNNGTLAIDLRGWLIGDATGNDTLRGGQFGGSGTTLQPLNFAIITDDNTRVYENFNVSLDALHLYVDDDAIGNGLNNNGETIFLYDTNGNLIDMNTYQNPGPGKSSSLVNGTWIATGPTPGSFANGTASGSCDYETQIVLEKSIFENQDEFSWKMVVKNIKGGSTLISSEAYIYDLFGNTKQDYRPFTNESVTRQRTSTTYSPNLAEGASYMLAANTTTDCLDTNLANNYDERIFTIKGTLIEESSLEILSILDIGSDDSAAFGQSIRARIKAYRGNTGMESISAWVEDDEERISKQARGSIEERYTEMTFMLPIQLIPNCDGKFDEGKYDVIIEGLGKKAKEKIEVEGVTKALCPNEKEEALQRTAQKSAPSTQSRPDDASTTLYAAREALLSKTSTAYPILDPKVAFSSSSQNAKESAPYFLVAALSMISLWLIFWRV
jgi:hypothetical protein